MWRGKGEGRVPRVGKSGERGKGLCEVEVL